MTVTSIMRQAFNEIFNELNEEITLRTITKDWDSEDDYNPTTSDSTENAVVIVMSDALAQEMGGELDVGDGYAYFKRSVSISKDDRLQHDGTWYTVKEVAKEQVGSNDVCIEARLEREG